MAPKNPRCSLGYQQPWGYPVPSFDFFIARRPLDNSRLLEVLPHDPQRDEGPRQARRHRKDNHSDVHGTREHRDELRHGLIGESQYFLALGKILSS